MAAVLAVHALEPEPVWRACLVLAELAQMQERVTSRVSKIAVTASGTAAASCSLVSHQTVAGALHMLVDLLAGEHEWVSAAAAHALAAVAQAESARAPMASVGVVEALIKALAKHASDEGIVPDVLTALALLVLDGAVAAQVVKAGGTRLALAALRKHERDEDVTHEATWLLNNLASSSCMGDDEAAAAIPMGSAAGARSL